MIPRTAETIIKRLTRGYPILAITGPRQSGKTTLARTLFPDKPYISLEDPENLQFALNDPRGFLGPFTFELTSNGMFDRLSTLKIFLFFKTSSNKIDRPLYFWRDSRGNEVDLLIEKGLSVIPIEIKSSKTITQDFFKELEYFKEVAKEELESSMLIYGGESNQTRSSGRVVPWYDIHTVLGELVKM